MADPHAIAARPEPDRHSRAIPLEDIDPDAVKVVRRLTRSGHEAYLVGGCVRDLLLGVRPKDFDLATSARPPQVRGLFRNCRIIGRRFRLAHILFGGGKVIEVATFRRGGEAEPTSPGDLLIRDDNAWGLPHEDALRRDFTINSLFYDLEHEQILDWTEGMDDIEARVVRTIGDPTIRFREDPVRILRAAKFAARLDLGIDPPVYDAMVAQRHELVRSARPRVLEEILRLLRGGAAHRSMWLLWETGVLAVLLPEVAGFLDDDAEAARVLWLSLQAADRMKADGRPLSDSALLGVLLGEPLRERITGTGDPLVEIDAVLGALCERLGVPRRHRERIRVALAVQRRLEQPPRGRAANLARRDFIADALDLCEVRLVATDQSTAALDPWRELVRSGPPPEAHPPRSRRRRGGRRRHVAPGPPSES
jgi:poly(A) polymerase